MKSCKMQMLPRWKSSNYLRDATVIGRENVLGFKWSICWIERGALASAGQSFEIFLAFKVFFGTTTGGPPVQHWWTVTGPPHSTRSYWKSPEGCQYHHRISSRKVSFLERSLVSTYPSPLPPMGLFWLRDRQSGRYIHLVIFLLFSKSFDLKIAKVTFCNLYYAQIGNLPGSLLRLQRGILVNEIKFLPNSISTTRHGKCLWITLWTSLDVTLIQKLWPTSLPTDLTKRWPKKGRKSTVLNQRQGPFENKIWQKHYGCWR